MTLSIITPAFNEADNLRIMHERLAAALAREDVDWEWLVIDDHSRDATFDVVRVLASTDSRVRGLRLARNSGSHTAIACGLHHVIGDAAVVLAADLQDPPEILASLVSVWRRGAQVVWAVRRQRPGEAVSALGFSRIYYAIMRHLVGMKEMPARGADFFLVDRTVIDAFRRFPERHVSVLALITSMGFRQAFIEYDKQRRHAGRSGWTLGRKIALVIDSVAGFSAFPLRACSYAGVALIAVALAWLVIAPTAWSFTREWTLAIGVILALGGAQLLALGILGEYVWRALDEARRRPAYLIEAVAGSVEPRVAVHE